MSCTSRPFRFVTSLFLLISGLNLASFAQRGGGGRAPQTPGSAATGTQNIQDFSRAPDPTNQTQVRFQPYDKSPLTFTSKPTYILVPVVVTEKDGKPISGLKREDFQFEENGKDQAIASLEEIKPSLTPLSRPAATAMRSQTRPQTRPPRDA